MTSPLGSRRDLPGPRRALRLGHAARLTTHNYAHAAPYRARVFTHNTCPRRVAYRACVFYISGVGASLVGARVTSSRHCLLRAGAAERFAAKRWRPSTASLEIYSNKYESERNRHASAPPVGRPPSSALSVSQETFSHNHGPSGEI